LITSLNDLVKLVAAAGWDGYNDKRSMTNWEAK